MSPLDLDPVATLVERLRREAAASFVKDKPIRVAWAPETLDVMGGTIEITGGLTLRRPLGTGGAVALQRRTDRRVSVLDLNLLDEHRPFQLEMPFNAITRPLDALRRDFAELGRSWAAPVAGCLAVLHESGLIDLATVTEGFNLAIYGDAPKGSAAATVATMNVLSHELDVRSLLNDGVRLAERCQRVRQQIAGESGGMVDVMTSQLGADGLLQILCQPCELRDWLALPGATVAGLRMDASPDPEVAQHARAAAEIGHRLIIDEMRRLGERAGKTMVAMPTGGYLANLPPQDYKALFRPTLPETVVEDGTEYRVQSACDHHVLEAQRVRRFADFLKHSDQHGREKALRSAGHLMYASHKSQRDHLGLAHSVADAIVSRVKQHESAGLYGARLTADGSTVAVLLEDTAHAADALSKIAGDLSLQIANTTGVSAGAVGTAVV